MIDASLSLLKNSKVQVQYEGCELIKELLKRPNLQDLVLLQLITILKIVTEDGDDTSDFGNYSHFKKCQDSSFDSKTPPTPLPLKDIHKKSENKSEWSSILSGGAKEDNSRARADTLLATYIQQAHCAKLLGYFAATSKALAKRMLHFQVVAGLLNTLANVNHSESQRHAASTLMVRNSEFV